MNLKSSTLAIALAVAVNLSHFAMASDIPEPAKTQGNGDLEFLLVSEGANTSAEIDVEAVLMYSAVTVGLGSFGTGDGMPSPLATPPVTPWLTALLLADRSAISKLPGAQKPVFAKYEAALYARLHTQLVADAADFVQFNTELNEQATNKLKARVGKLMDVEFTHAALSNAELAQLDILELGRHPSQKVQEVALERALEQADQLTKTSSQLKTQGKRVEHAEFIQLPLEKVRDAYKAQFDIGQRSVTDLISLENSHFMAAIRHHVEQFRLHRMLLIELAKVGQLPVQ